MILYTFEKLAKRLTQLGYPETTVRVIPPIIKRDLTHEEQADKIKFKDDGVYLTIDGQEYKGYMYLKYPDVNRNGFPKFHITNCKIILERKANGRFDGEYFWQNSNTVTIEDRINGQVYENINLSLCNYCRKQFKVNRPSDAKYFFSVLDKQKQDDELEPLPEGAVTGRKIATLNQQELVDINQDRWVDIFGYTSDWQIISKEYKKEKKYTCESCGIMIEIPGDRRFMHVDHKSGSKLNNRRSNLECLCILCHANKDKAHIHNFERRRMQIEVKAFVEKYTNTLTKLGNKYLE